MVKKFDWYPAEDTKKALKRKSPKPPKVRAGVEPGRVLILLAGRFKGKRVVFLKQLKSGLLCVTGPFKLNGVPVKRVNQVYTLSTSTKVKLDGVKLDKISDDTFAKKVKKSRSHKFFAENAPAKEVAAERKQLQKEVDGALMQQLTDKMV